MTERLLFSAAAPFEAARHVSVLPEGHRARNMHGHSFKARVRTPLEPGWAEFPGAEASALREMLSNVAGALDYQLLNDHLDIPTDENLAHWIRERLDLPNIEFVGVQSTDDQGADLDQQGRAHVWRRFRFESAHCLPNVPKGHQCGRMHGHGFEVILHANQPLNGHDMGVDFDRLEELWQPFHNRLHMHCLNDIVGLENPTSEMLAAWLWEQIKPMLPELSWVTVYETVTAGCHYDGEHYRIWKEFRFESAVRLLRAPQEHPASQLHGHSYLIRLHLTAPLDQVLGWTVDYGDVKEVFKPTYKTLDHHLLNELESVGDGDLESLLRWTKACIGDGLPQLDRIDLYDTPGCGALLSWGARSPALPT